MLCCLVPPLIIPTDNLPGQVHFLSYNLSDGTQKTPISEMTGIYNSKGQLPKRHTFQIRP